MSDVDDFTELVDFEPDQVDLVGGPANGVEILVAKSAEGEPVGLFGPDFVRELVAKADADEAVTRTAAEPVTFSGSPAAVADLMHRMRGAPVRKADLSTAELNDLPDSAFAYIEPGGTKDSDGKTTPRKLRHFAIHDKAHADDAAARIAQGAKFGDKAKVKVEAAQRKFGEKVTKADAADPGSPAWEAQDAASAQQVIDQILACIPAVKTLAMREATEVAAGHEGDVWDVLDLRDAVDSLTCAAKTVGAFAVAERAEAGDTVAKSTAASAAPSLKEKTVEQQQATTEVAKAEDTAAAGAEQAQTQPISKAAALAALGFTMEQLAELGAQSVVKAAQGEPPAAATQTADANQASADSARVIPGTNTVQAPAQQPDQDVAKAQADQLAAALGQVMAPVVKQLGELATQVNAQQERVEKAMARPDDRKSPALNGATGTTQVADRTNEGSPIHSPEFEAVAKAIAELPEGEARESAQRAVGLAAIKARFGHAG